MDNLESLITSKEMWERAQWLEAEQKPRNRKEIFQISQIKYVYVHVFLQIF